MKLTKKSNVTASRTLESIQWGKTAVVPASTIQSIANDIQDHLDTLYPELDLECFVEILKDYRGYQSIHVSTYPYQVYEPVLKYYVFLHDTTVAYYGDTKVKEDSLDVREDYADTVCDIITEHVSKLPGRITGSTEVLGDIQLTQDYFYDTVKNMEDNGWDDILEWFRSNAWIHNGALIVPAGTKLNWVSEDRYYNTYRVYTPAGTKKIPFLKPEMGGDPLTTSQLSTSVTSSEYVEDFDDIVDDPNCQEQAIRLIKDAAKAHNYIGDIDKEIEEVGSSPESLYQIYHDIIDVGAEVQSDGLGNWRFLLPSETEYDEPVIHTDMGYYVVCSRGSIQLVPIDEAELFYE